jgi:hypothetical protein
MVRWWCVTLMLGLVVAPELRAQATVTVSGVVIDSATRQPLAGAIIELVGLDHRHTTRTDEAGEFQIGSVQPGAYRASVRRIGYRQVITEIIVETGMKPVDLKLAPIPQTLREVRVKGEGAGIYGQIGSALDLKPIPGAVVQVGGSRDSVVTDSVGAYFVPLKTFGRYMIRVRAPGYAEEMFIVDVKKNEVADGSRLLDYGESRHVTALYWQDFDQRMSWRTRNNGALLSGSDVRRAGGDITTSLKMSGEMVAKGLKLGSSVCVFVNGVPRPGYHIDAIRPEEVTAIEAYTGRSGPVPLLASSWPAGFKCTETGERRVQGGGGINYLVIWTK